MHPLQIALITQSGCRIVDVAGEIDLDTCEEFDSALAQGRVPHTPLVADLLDVGFCDASGLRTLLSAHARADEWDTPLRIVPSRQVGLILRLTGADGVLNVYIDRDRALVDAASSQSTAAL